MSGGFGLPILDIAGALGKLGRSYQDNYDTAFQRTALTRLGEQVQGGDYANAAKTAFGAGDVQTGIGLLKLGEDRRKQQLTTDADADFAKNMGGGFGVGGPVGAPGGGPAPAPGVPSFLDQSGPQGDYLANMFKRESNNNPTAQASWSSARGLGQFTKGTWNSVAQRYPELNLTPVTPNSDGRIDPDQMLRASKAFTAENEGLLSKSGLPVNDATRYSMHIFGSGGGRRFVAGTLSNPDVPASAYVGADQVAANRPVFFRKDGTPKTAGEVMNDFARSFGGGGGGRGAPQAPAPQVASADPSFAPSMQGPANRPLQVPVQGLNPGRPQQAAPAQRPVQFADDENQTQVLEGRMGMYPSNVYGVVPQGGASPQAPAPRPVAAADPQADLPAPGAQNAQFVIPPGPQAVAGSVASLPAGLSSPQPRGPLVPQSYPPSSDNNARNIPSTPTLPGTAGPAPSRVMVMPGEGPAPAAQAAPASPTDRAFQAQASNISQSPLGARIPMLMRAVANPNLSDGPRQIAQTMLKQALEETAAPPGVREYLYARANGMTQAKSPAEYDREKQRDKGADLTAETNAREAAAVRFGLQPGTPEFQNYVLNNRPAAERQTEAEKITAGTAARREAAVSQGLDPTDPRIRDFIVSGNLPKENQQQLTAGDRKAINDAEDHALLLDQTLSTLGRAKELNDKTFTGSTAGIRGKIGTTVPGAGYIIDPKAAADTREFGQIMSMEAIKAMSSTLKGATTDREMDRFVEILGDPATPPDIRKRTLDRMETLAQRQRDLVQARIGQMREGTYYRPGGGASAGAPAQGRASAAGGGQSGAPALPAPSPSNRPGAVSPADRFGQLVGSGMSKADAYQQLHQEGY